MDDKKIKLLASIGLFIGGTLGLAGSFAPTDSLRCMAWVIDGVALTIACAILANYYYRKQFVITAVGFLIFAIGESFILSSTSLNIEDHVSTFGVGTSLWALSLLVISSQTTFPVFVRCTGLLAAVLFAIASALIFTNYPIHALSRPLPFFAYPFFVVTIFGWAWTLIKKDITNQKIVNENFIYKEIESEKRRSVV